MTARYRNIVFNMSRLRMLAIIINFQKRNRKMKKTILLFLALIMIAFSGCSRIDKHLGEARLNKSGISEDEDYKTYINKLYNNEIDVDGYIIVKDEPSYIEVPHKDKVHVTFADNNSFDISYSLNGAAGLQTINAPHILSPGDTITAKLNKNNKNCSLYTLSEYKIIEFDGSGNSTEISNITVDSEETKYTIPAELVGKDISIVPIGKYEKGTLILETCYYSNGLKGIIENPGEWIIDGRELSILESKEVKLHPAYDYKIKLKYDKEDYFFVKSNPAPVMKDLSSGEIEFASPDFNSEKELYSVELHNYLKLSVKCNSKATIQVKYTNPKKITKNKEDYDIKKNKVWESQKLEFGDVIIVETEGKCTIVDGDYKNMNVKRDSIGEKNKYTITVVPDNECNIKDISVDVVDVVRTYNITLDTNCAHGECVYKLDKKKVSGTVQVKGGQELTLTYTITDDNYKFETEPSVLGKLSPFHKQKRTVEIPIDNELSDKTICPDSWFRIVKKESSK